jgi:hypothetical protein
MIDSARRMPDESVLNELKMFFGAFNRKDEKELVAIAENALQGQIEYSGKSSVAYGFPFDPSDLERNEPGWKLFFAKFSIPNLMLKAYEVSNRDAFLIAARDIIVQFADYERKAWFPKGYLWNDHAIAARVSVLIKFWKLYRSHPIFEADVASVLLQLIARSAQILAEPAHYTFATNHGIIQNLALWQICIAFPSLPQVEYYKQLAFERMNDQIQYYINNEGVVLEHSADYQRIGLILLEKAFKYKNLLDLQISEEWKRKYRKGKEVYNQLKRPDGSLPLFGDTPNRRNTNDFRRYSMKSGVQKLPHSLYPVAGYSVWWNGFNEWPNASILSQTVIIWSYFPGHAHKHADEMSILLWANGNNWWTNIGYWPFGTKGRSHAISWAGSNAPHLVNEPAESKRQTRLMSYGWSDSLCGIDLKRRGPDKYVARRQVINVKPNVWIVLDHTNGSQDQRTTTTWTTSPHVSLSKDAQLGSYTLETEKNEAELTKFILTSKGGKTSQMQGSFLPFAGWIQGLPTQSIVVEQPANDSWAAAIWLLKAPDGENCRFESEPFMQEWKNEENWAIQLPLASGLMLIRRTDDRFFVQKDAKETLSQVELQLLKPPQISDKHAEITAAYENAAGKYPQKSYSLNRNLRLSFLLVVLVLVQEAFFLFHRRCGWKHYTGLRVMSIFGWIAVWVLSAVTL